MSWNWSSPPGDRPSTRALARKVLVSLLVGMLSVGVAWAGTGLVPVNDTGQASSEQEDNWLQNVEGSSEGGDQAAAVTDDLPALAADQVYAGAAKVSIDPNPTKYGATWETDPNKCETIAGTGDPTGQPGKLSNTDPMQVPDYRVRWHENTNCIYAGGFDIGPANSISVIDDSYGLHVRATAISDGNDTVVLMILDGTYYFAEYNNMCNDKTTYKSDWDDGPGANQYTQDCGFRDLGQSMAEKYGYTSPTARGEFGIEPASFFLASSHAHASPDFIGAWGGVPRWYMQQVEDAIRQAVYDAIDGMKPAYVEGSEILYRTGNNNRRGHYYGAEESGYSWMRFVSKEAGAPVCTTITPSPSDVPSPSPSKIKPEGRRREKPSPSPSPTPTPTPYETCSPGAERNAVISTVGTYAAHPTSGVGEHREGYADLAGAYATAAEQKWVGSVGLFFQTGFGDQSARGSREFIGANLVDILPAPGSGPQIRGDMDVRSSQVTFDNPVTNSVLGSGGISGIFDRPMTQKPSAVSIGRNSQQPGDPDFSEDPDGRRSPHKRCNSASPISVTTSVSAARIGPADGGLLITGGPGELFSNLTNTIKEQNVTGVTMPLSLVNDGIGYIMQSFETDHLGRQGQGFTGDITGLAEYEDAYSIDACLGDNVLLRTIRALESL